ncbi:MAG: glycosyltransferase family 2 protein [Gemmatimonadaceae bacterium]|nr:glycosyltransferase family 2 protein [Gemmatimonadaceae bacterium]
MLNIVVPMAGRGSRFVSEGFTLPKPLIPVHGRPMLEVVVNNIRPARAHRFIYLCLAEHIEAYELRTVLERLTPGCEIVSVDTVTEGAACTVLLARRHIDGDDPLMIANSDQWVDASIDDYLAVQDQPGVDGLIMTMWADHPKWSYIGFDDTGRALRVVEKEVVSNEATVGIYNFRRGADFVRAADQMIAKALRVNGEFYVAPVYNQLIDEGMTIAHYNVGKELDGMYGLGIPSDLAAFTSLPVSRKAVTF